MVTKGNAFRTAISGFAQQARSVRSSQTVIKMAPAGQAASASQIGPRPTLETAARGTKRSRTPKDQDRTKTAQGKLQIPAESEYVAGLKRWESHWESHFSGGEWRVWILVLNAPVRCGDSELGVVPPGIGRVHEGWSDQRFGFSNIAHTDDACLESHRAHDSCRLHRLLRQLSHFLQTPPGPEILE